jgi:hypothetical protein
MLTREDTSYAQVERVLNSATFRNAEVLRRLLKFIAEKSAVGESEQLKEYTIAVDGLGKPPNYDPRQDSLVRIEIGRLRNKLADFYRTEGEHDPIVLTIPKGHFKLIWETRTSLPPVQPPSQSAPTPATLIAPSKKRWSRIPIIVVFVLAVWAVSATIFLQERRNTSPLHAAWTPALQELWNPFLEPKRPLTVAVSAPLFVGFQGNGFYRDQTLNDWNEVLASSKVKALRKALNNPPIVPRYYYTGLGEMSASFQLGELLGNSGLDISTTWSSVLSWQQIVDDNILIVGPARVFNDQLRKLPVHLKLALREDGIHELEAKSNDAALFADNFPSINGDQSTLSDDGTVYALVSRMPGPLGSGYIQTFSSNHSPGTEGAVKFFTKPSFADQLIAKLRKSDRRLPRFFQVVIKVVYRDATPIDISYVTMRELQPEVSATPPTESSLP